MGPLRQKLCELEVRYEMSTDEMLRKFRAGELKDTADVSKWLILAQGRGG